MFDFAVIGSGFSGSLMATILARQGRSVLMIDRGSHPRFAIGESSTPAGNMILRDLAKRFDLPSLESISRWGSWKREYPSVGCGLKRGFSYYYHTPQMAFHNGDGNNNDNSLLVAASSADEVGDTQWYRHDVDALLATQAEATGVINWQQSQITHIERTSHAWQLDIQRNDSSESVRASFVIDATGSAGGLVKALALPTATLNSNSWAVYSHFDNVTPWKSVLTNLRVHSNDHPFATDRSALHHLFPGGWMWQLRFDSDTLSAGFVFDGRDKTLEDAPPEQIWTQQLRRFPSIAEQFVDAELSPLPGRMLKSGRLQRLVTQPAGDNWLLLPGTAGFIDPLHSTGIAQTLAGIEFCLDAFEQCDHQPWSHATWLDWSRQYARRLAAEFDLIDKFVDGAYQLHSNFRSFANYCMAYFAAAISYEIAREELGKPPPDGFLMSQNPDFTDAVSRLYRATSSQLNDDDFEDLVTRELKPFNRVGLCNSSLNNMYAYTAHE